MENDELQKEGEKCSIREIEIKMLTDLMRGSNIKENQGEKPRA